mmetsp:Transcript_22444/g.62511  ORF Transcript_22444/g.62511 Transcript_22444/m.62511 type:complete len:204 (+) Transcript_22444:201-812(+)
MISSHLISSHLVNYKVLYLFYSSQECHKKSPRVLVLGTQPKASIQRHRRSDLLARWPHGGQGPLHSVGKGLSVGIVPPEPGRSIVVLIVVIAVKNRAVFVVVVVVVAIDLLVATDIPGILKVRHPPVGNPRAQDQSVPQRVRDGHQLEFQTRVLLLLLVQGGQHHGLVLDRIQAAGRIADDAVFGDAPHGPHQDLDLERVEGI